MRLFAIQNESILKDIGLKNGDILKRLNGNSLADMSQASNLYAMLREERSFSLEFQRNLKDLVYNYDIK